MCSKRLRIVEVPPGSLAEGLSNQDCASSTCTTTTSDEKKMKEEEKKRRRRRKKDIVTVVVVVCKIEHAIVIM